MLETRYKKQFLDALAFTLKWEGGYSNHPMDKGGPTLKGVTQYTYDEYRKSKKLSNQPVKLMTDDEMRYIYYTFYYLPSKCFLMSNKLSICVFDTAVHSGVRKALILLSNCMNDPHKYIDSRERFLRSISKGKNRVFLKGWLNRINSLRQYINNIKD